VRASEVAIAGGCARARDRAASQRTWMPAQSNSLRSSTRTTKQDAYFQIFTSSVHSPEQREGVEIDLEATK